MSEDLSRVWLFAYLMVAIGLTALIVVGLLGRWTTAARQWALALLSVVGSQAGYLLVIPNPGARWPWALGAGFTMLAIGFLWTGGRSFNGRGNRVALPVNLAIAAVSFLVVLVLALFSPPPTTVRTALVILLAALLVRECLGPRLRDRWPGWVLGCAVAAYAAFAVVRVVALWRAGSLDALPPALGVEGGGYANFALIVVSIVMVSLLILLDPPSEADSAEHGQDGPVLPARVFRRLLAAHAPEALLTAQIADFDAVRTLLGLPLARELDDALAAAVLAAAPEGSVVGSLGPGRTGVLTPAGPAGVDSAAFEAQVRAAFTRAKHAMRVEEPLLLTFRYAGGTARRRRR